MMILFDTDTVSALLRQERRAVAHALRVPARLWHVSTITVGEVLVGVEKSGRHEHIRLALEEQLLPAVTVLTFVLPSARIYARLRAELERQGQRLHEPDLRIASIALAHDLTLITGNEKHFARVPELRVENWLA